MQDESQSQIKDLYRRAMQICHPDRSPEHLRPFLEAKTKALNTAMTENDFATIRQIAAELGVKNVPPLSESSPPTQQKPTKEEWFSALLKGNADKVRQFLAAGMDPNTTGEDISGLMGMAARGNVQIVKILLAAGANPNAAVNNSATAVNGATALEFAAHEGQSEVIKVLLDNGADANSVNEFGGIPLMTVALTGHAEIVKIFLAAGANPNAADKRQRTTLMIASANGHVEIVKMLLAAGANPNAASKEGYTPLRWATGGRHAEVVRLLKEAGAVEIPKWYEFWK